MRQIKKWFSDNIVELIALLITIGGGISSFLLDFKAMMTTFPFQSIVLFISSVSLTVFILRTKDKYSQKSKDKIRIKRMRCYPIGALQAINKAYLKEAYRGTLFDENTNLLIKEQVFIKQNNLLSPLEDKYILEPDCRMFLDRNYKKIFDKNTLQFIATKTDNTGNQLADEMSDNESNANTQQYEYWAAFNEYCSQNDLFANGAKAYKPSEDYRHTVYHVSGKNTDISVKRILHRKSIQVSFDIHDNKKLYDHLFSHKEEIETSAALKFSWKRLDNKKISYIQIEKEFLSIEEKDNWSEQFEWAMEIIQKLIKATKPFVQ